MKFSIIIFFLIFLIFSGCSPTENPNEGVIPKEPFFEATFLGKTYTNFYKDVGYSFPDNCTTGERDLNLKSIGRIESSNVLLQANFIAPILLSNWASGDNIPGSRIIGNHIRGGCHEPFDLEITLKVENEVEVMETSENFSNIEQVIFISEDSETENYMFEGSFQVNYIGENEIVISVEGKYNVPVVFNKN